MERFVGAFIHGDVAPDGEPTSATNLTLSFVDDSLTGTLSFEAPTESWDGDELAGELSYKVSADGELMTEGKVAAGAIATTSEFTLTQGNHEVSVVLANEAGEGLNAIVSAWIGNDAPVNVADIKVAAEGYNVNISWTAPEIGLHQGYINPEEVTYTVIRQPVNVVVAENITANSVTDVITESKLAKY